MAHKLNAILVLSRTTLAREVQVISYLQLNRAPEILRSAMVCQTRTLPGKLQSSA
jgi:hypothetical protein